MAVVGWKILHQPTWILIEHVLSGGQLQTDANYLKMNVDRGRSKYALQGIPVPLDIFRHERRQVFIGFRPHKAQEPSDDLLITSKRSRRSLFGRYPVLKMLTDGSDRKST